MSSPNYDTYQTPLTGRYSSKEMQHMFSPRNRFTTWRKLWLWLAESEHELGLPISKEAIDQLREHTTVQDKEFAVIAEEEKRRRHDVMACVHAYGQVAPAAAGIIHWGATSCYVADNAELMFMRDGLKLLLPKFARVIKQLRNFAMEHKDMACLSYTHLQAAVPSTVGRRASLWLSDLLMDLRNVERALGDLKFRGAKGTTGTQASYLEIFSGDHDKVERLDELVTEKAGFDSAYTVTGQTYSRKVDLEIVGALCGFGATCERIGIDIRHLAKDKEVEEPFEKYQIGSSAMPWKRNPMRSERLCSIGRWLRDRYADFTNTYAAQIFERTLDDSAIRRAIIPESFLSADACLILLENVTAGLVVYPAVMEKHLRDELPFMITEPVIMELVAKGKSRQEAHEKVRVLSQEAAGVVKNEAKENDLLERIRKDEFFKEALWKVDELMNPKVHVGRSPELVRKLCEGDVDSALEKYKDVLEKQGEAEELKV